ncbi:uncharacterized protein LOC143202988 [Rhynchophorus ferrugineus]|uniref:Uncharacterized protein n=1 Tax=Rhynchophorus ferrugineus TaxID=354439 RepID=A0A834I9R7_RHYFE|nr:hypothetical protein GWI33_017159 [Rhynchophorus ferrugineus]
MEGNNIVLNVHEVCFTCLSNNNLICVPGNHEEYNEFVKMFYMFTSIEIKENVIVICEACVTRLNESNQFREMCIESYKVVHSLYEENNVKKSAHSPESNYDDKNELNSDLVILSEQNYNLEGSCRDISADSVVDLPGDVTTNNEQEDTLSTSKPIVCETCPETFSDILQLQLHITTSHSEQADKPETVVNEEQNNFTCSKCGKAFMQLILLKQHVKNHLNLKSNQEKQLKSNIFICSVCGKECTTKFLLNRHMICHSGKKPFECSLCPSTFYTTCDLNIHMRVHTGAKPYTCPICDKPFRRSSHLTVHMRTHTGEKPYQCNTCCKSFAQSGDLTAHQRIHTGEKPFVCQFCQKGFVQGSALKTHLKRHFKVYCSTCKNLFISYAALKEHQKTCQISECTENLNKV